MILEIGTIFAGIPIVPRAIKAAIKARNRPNQTDFNKNAIDTSFFTPLPCHPGEK
jgi:hypothetical protein